MGTRYHRSVRVFRKGEGPLSLQPSLLPSSLDDFLPGDHQVRGLRRLVEDRLGSRLRSMARDCGGIRHDPVGLFCVWVFGMMQGERSSRRLEELCRYDVRYAHLCGGVRPDHSTLARFRVELGEVLAELFAQICAVGNEQGLLSGRSLAIDGTKVPGATTQWKKALAQADLQDERTMLDGRKHFVTGYNVQAGVDTQSRFIAGCEVTQDANDSDQMARVLASVKAATGRLPVSAIADSGYDSPSNHQALSKARVEGFIVPHSHRGKLLTRQADGSLACPAGHQPSKLETRKRGIEYDVYRVSQCRKCPLKLKCGVKGHQKEVNVQKGMDPAFGAAHAQKMSSETAQAMIRLRGPTVELAFAQLKAIMRFDRFRLRGLRKAGIEMLLLASAYNLRLLLSLLRLFLAVFPAQNPLKNRQGLVSCSA